MDALADLLQGVRARGALFSRSIMSPPWGLEFRNPARLTLCTLLSGEAWIVPEHGEPRLLRAGDVALVRGPQVYKVADRPDTPAGVIVLDAERCVRPDGTDLCEQLCLGPRTYGEAPTGPAVLISAAYQVHGDISERLLSALPPLLVLPDDQGPCALLRILELEIDSEEPGQQLVLDRLLDLLLVLSMRCWFNMPEANPPAWYLALSDPVAGAALRALHADPARAWTVAALAGEVGVSRATLARRFTELVGEPPLTYLTGWRMALAADLLRDPDETVARVARRVGYADGFAFSSAFKRTRGVSPSVHRVAG
ncbi:MULTISPECIES: AraC family transcriptional regulator [unclassified Crossiella]|uniref:AraC family transcriptional regulator n=1 Tax=unclassified Crossiella TaxID=2620835 RepID=UPI001FFEB8CB|nr:MULTISPECIES: AraC family transcriptional regulator [unclassified Crossiella]MCK2240442.1 AraC family transcriptional regulator [Crossiella sp. S99.2]MCK2253106.1 AraC family transcriptional regulator [Crossiella sp. S99.1]